MTRLILTTREQDTFEEALRRQIAAFSENHPDIQIEVVPRPIHDHYELMVEQGGAADVDLFLCCTDWLPAADAKGLIRRLDGWLDAEAVGWPTKWHPAMQKLAVREGRWIGLPWHDGPQVFMVRQDLLNDSEHQKQFEDRYQRPLTVPQTWSEFVEVGAYFTDPENDQWGCVTAGLTDGHNNVYDFLIQLWSRGGVLLDEDFQPRFDDAIGVEALTFCHDLYHAYRIVSPHCLGLGSVESGDYFARGRAAMMWNWCGFAAVCELPRVSQIAGKCRCYELPKGDGPGHRSVSLNIYWTLTVGANCKNLDAARAFLTHVARPDQDRITSEVGANGTQLSTWNDPQIQARYPHYKIIEQVHGGTLTLPAIPEYTEINEAISRAVHRVVHDREPAAASLAQAADETRLILKQSGRIKG